MRSLILALLLLPMVASAQLIDLGDWLPIRPAQQERKIWDETWVVGDEPMTVSSEMMLVDIKGSVLIDNKSGWFTIHWESMPVGLYFLYSDVGLRRFMVIH